MLNVLNLLTTRFQDKYDVCALFFFNDEITKKLIHLDVNFWKRKLIYRINESWKEKEKRIKSRKQIGKRFRQIIRVLKKNKNFDLNTRE